MLTQFQARSEVMRNAVENGVIDTVITDSFNDPYICNLLGYPKEKMRRQNPNTFEVWQHSQSQRWQENALDTALHTTTTEYFAVELARFTVPKGQVGFVRHLEQVVNDATGSYYPSNVSYWGSPHFVLPDVDNLRWYLKLDYFDGTLPARFTLSTPTPFTSQSLPGMPYNDLHEIDALWYPAHHKKALKLIIPGNRMLRLYVFTPPTTTYQWQFRGKLTGVTQSTYSVEAIDNSRILR